MDSEKRFNPIAGFNYKLLDDPEFKEDSVREEIIVPIIKGLGYTANGPGKIVRSRKLIHPFVSIGSQQKKIHIVPDYLFEIDNKPIWILEAKSPDQNIRTLFTSNRHILTPCITKLKQNILHYVTGKNSYYFM